jgi:thioredoxin 1
MGDHTNLFHVSDAEFESKVLKSDEPVIVDFWAEWCGPCRAIGPVFERLSDSGKYQGKLSFAKLDIEKHQKTPNTYGVQAIPTLIVFKNGEPVSRIVGPHPYRLEGEIDRILAEN